MNWKCSKEFLHIPGYNYFDYFLGVNVICMYMFGDVYLITIFNLTQCHLFITLAIVIVFCKVCKGWS